VMDRPRSRSQSTRYRNDKRKREPPVHCKTHRLYKFNVNSMCVQDWEDAGFEPKQAQQCLKLFSKNRPIFYDQNPNHCYIGSDIKLILYEAFAGPPHLDTHSCKRANDGPNGLGAKEFYGKDAKTDGFSENWNAVKCFSNPPFHPHEANCKMAAKLLFELDRRRRAYIMNDLPYEHIVLHARKFIGERWHWWKPVKERSQIWIKFFGQKFREWDGTKFVEKYVKNENVLMYFVIGPPAWREERIRIVRELFSRHLNYSVQYWNEWKMRQKPKHRSLRRDPRNVMRSGTPDSESES